MNARAASLSIALLAFAALSAVDVVIFRGMDERDRLRSRNDGEQTMNALFTSLRDHDDFGSAIEASSDLESRIVGVGVYGAGARLYSWGSVPESYESPSSGRQADSRAEGENPIRTYIENPKADSLILLLEAPGQRPPPPAGEPDRAGSDQGDDRSRSFMKDTMRDADVVYLEIRQSDYWRRRRLDAILLPVSGIAVAALVLFVRGLVLRNAGYRKLIEEQRNLVIMGTAASTLAHEIKNPLLAIRLQTSILSRICPESARRELAIIDEEVERLSSLSHRVNDYLRDPAGNPAVIDPGEILREVGSRLCGRDIMTAPSAEVRQDCVRIDPERLRSLLENLVRNALESGGPESDVAIETSAADGELRIDVLDRGSGIAAAARERAFDPFFTTKSRGTGIGLAICERFAAAAGGKLTLDGRTGGGTRARLALPLAGGRRSGRGIPRARGTPAAGAGGVGTAAEGEPT